MKHLKKTAVFVCEHGTVKSVVALELFTRLACEKDLTFQAVSRGTRPDLTVPVAVREGLGRADGRTAIARRVQWLVDNLARVQQRRRR